MSQLTTTTTKLSVYDDDKRYRFSLDEDGRLISVSVRCITHSDIETAVDIHTLSPVVLERYNHALLNHLMRQRGVMPQ